MSLPVNVAACAECAFSAAVLPIKLFCPVVTTETTSDFWTLLSSVGLTPPCHYCPVHQLLYLAAYCSVAASHICLGVLHVHLI